MGAELCGGVADRGQRAQHQQLALGQSESAAGVEVAEAEPVRNRGSAVSNGSGRSARLSLISLPYRGAWTARPLAYRSASATVPCSGRGSGILA